MTRTILAENVETEVVKVVFIQCLVCKGTCRQRKTFCFKCNRRGVLTRPTPVMECRHGERTMFGAILQDLSAIAEHLRTGNGTDLPPAYVYFADEQPA